MNRKEFTYSLTNKTGLFYYVDNDIVKTTLTPTPLQYSPDGWKDQLVNYARNETYYGIFRSYTIPLQFVFDGAQILRSRLYVYGMEDVVNLVINRLNYDTGQYDLFYTGEIDFSKFEDSIDVFKVNVIEGGLSKYVKAYENVNQEIPLNKDFIKVKMDGISLQQSAQYVVTNGDTTYNNGNHIVQMTLINTESIDNLGAKTENRLKLKNLPQNVDMFASKNYFLKTGNSIVNAIVEYDITLTITLSDGIPPNPYVQYFLTLRTFNTSGIVTGILLEQVNGPYLVYKKHRFVGTKSININANHEVYLFSGINIIGPSADEAVFFEYDDTVNNFFNIKYNYRFKTTTIKAKKALSVGNELIKKIADNTHSLESNILKNTTIAITCGDAIRGIQNAIIKTNFKDFFTSFNRNLEIAGSINNKKFIIEAKKTAYNNTLLYDLGEIKDAKFDFYEQLLANSIKIGYANQDYDDLNGRDEFNNTSEFKAPITRVNKLYDLTAPYRADMFGIEFTRINLQGKTTTDNNSDNDVFMLDVEYDFTDADGIENYKLRRPAFTSITGLIDPQSAFNIDLSPKRIFNKHGAWIRGMMWPLTTEKITFQTTNKNPLLKTVQGGVTIQENADVIISDLEQNYWIPITAKFETIVPENLIYIMQSNSTGLFQFTYNGDTYKGWVIACSQKPSTDVEQQWTLLLSADNNINKLIHG